MNELLLAGPVSDQELEELNQELGDVQVLKYQTKGLPISEIVQLIFHNFNLITFTRDYLLATSLTTVIKQIKHAVFYLSERNKKVEYVNLNVKIKSDNKEFTLYLSSDSERIDMAISLTEDKIKLVVDSAPNGGVIHVNLEKNSTDIDINKL